MMVAGIKNGNREKRKLVKCNRWDEVKKRITLCFLDEQISECWCHFLKQGTLKEEERKEKGANYAFYFECLALVPVGYAGSWAKAETNEKIWSRNVTFGT